MKTPTKDYYQILGIPENAKPDEIKKTYRRLAVEHHPDRNPNDPKSENRFKEITEAYGVLMDPVKRKEYDQFRSGPFSGSPKGPHFNYSQQEIFENMFRQAFGRDIFNDLNTEFKNSGFRSGPGFFGTILSSGAAGTLGRFMRMIPGPIGKIGTGLWLLQTVGTSLYNMNKKRKERRDDSQDKSNGEKSVKDSTKTFFGKSEENKEQNLNLNFEITIPATEAMSGVKKQIAYKLGDQTERLVVSIPPGFPSGKNLRIREKGYRKDNKRGDLILTVKVHT
ncbi:MAG: J domain-containing protein [Nitrospina sp.]|nr:MAG: J domain-containing protein [Nitrospina sp.]